MGPGKGHIVYILLDSRSRLGFGEEGRFCHEDDVQFPLYYLEAGNY